MRGVTLFLAICALALAACGGDEGGSGSCSGDSDCATGKLCQKGSCGIVDCAGASDCGEGQTCVDVDYDGSKQCTLVDCAKNADCAAKAEAAGEAMICVQGACLAKDTTPEPDVSEPDAGGDGVEPGDTAQPPVGTGTLCQPCDEDADCVGGFCASLAEGDFCSVSCDSNDQCPSGYLCFALSTAGKACVPGLYSTCPACLQTPCAAGQACDQAAGQCKDAAGECGACTRDADCGLGMRCYAFSAEIQRCVPECGAEGGCPVNATCSLMSAAQGTEGVRVCAPMGATCCFGEGCAVCDCSATPATPLCNPAGECVQCLSNADCPAAKPTCEAGSCKAPNCPSERPIPCSQGTGGCCECTNDSHCTDNGAPYCNVAAGACSADQQCACEPPFPACLVSDGQIVCVECTQDADCSAGCTCAPDNTCVNAQGAACGTGIPPAECTGCASDGDCPAAEGFTIACDTASGCCFDAAGKCDNVNAFCAPGSVCTGMVELIGLDLSALGGMIPGFDIGSMMGDMANYCSCPPECLGGVSCITADEVADAAMGDLGGLLGGLLGDIGGDSTYCVDPASVGDLLGGLLGGGGLPSFP